MVPRDSRHSGRRDRSARVGALPGIATPLFGREDDLAGIHQLLADGVRLLTLTGAGGTGKTRLARAAAAAADQFGDNVHFVDLSAVETPSLVPASVAQALGIQQTGSEPIEPIVSEVLAEAATLLVLDNFEQVLGAAAFVNQLLAVCSELVVLVTSREPLHLRVERVFPVQPLPVPGTDLTDPLQAAANPAVALFLDRGRACQPTFDLSRDNLGAVVEICTRLDGLPLAIELAAAQLRVLSPRAIVTRLHARAPFLLGAARDAPARHQTLAAAVESSYDLLDTIEKIIFRRCGVFAGGFTAAAAAAVCGPFEPPIDILGVLAVLVDKSLLRATEEPNGEPRFRWLETIRAYALDRLGELGELSQARQRHAQYFLRLADESEAALVGQGMGDTLDQLEREYDNFRAVFHWSLDGGDLANGLALSGSLYRFWMLRGHIGEAREWLDRALPKSENLAAAVRAKALNAAGVLAGMQDDNDRAEAYFERSLTLWRELRDAGRMASAIGNLGLVAQNRNDLDRAQLCFQESEALYEAARDQRGIAVSIGCRARVARQQGRDADARPLFERTAAMFRELGDDRVLSNALVNLGHTALALNDLVVAVASFRESLELRRALGTLLGIAECIEGFAAAAVADGRERRAARLFGAAEALREITGAHLSILEREGTARLVATIRERLGETSFAAEWAAGRATGTNEAAELALEPTVDQALQSQSTDAGPPSVLTRREREVAALVARGLTNRDVAAQLVVAERTVETHLEHIFVKLGVQTRSEVAVWVTRQGMLEEGDGIAFAAQAQAKAASPGAPTSGSGRLGRRR